MDSFSVIEKKLHDLSVDNVLWSHDLSKAIAHSFTQYILGYLTTEGVAQSLVRHGANRKMAADLAKMFAEVRGQASTSQRTKPETASNETNVVVSL